MEIISIIPSVPLGNGLVRAPRVSITHWNPPNLGLRITLPFGVKKTYFGLDIIYFDGVFISKKILFSATSDGRVEHISDIFTLQRNLTYIYPRPRKERFYVHTVSVEHDDIEVRVTFSYFTDGTEIDDIGLVVENMKTSNSVADDKSDIGTYIGTNSPHFFNPIFGTPCPEKRTFWLGDFDLGTLRDAIATTFDIPTPEQLLSFQKIPQIVDTLVEYINSGEYLVELHDVLELYERMILYYENISSCLSRYTGCECIEVDYPPIAGEDEAQKFFTNLMLIYGIDDAEKAIEIARNIGANKYADTAIRIRDHILNCPLVRMHIDGKLQNYIDELSDRVESYLRYVYDISTSLASKAYRKLLERIPELRKGDGVSFDVEINLDEYLRGFEIES